MREIIGIYQPRVKVINTSYIDWRDLNANEDVLDSLTSVRLSVLIPFKNNLRAQLPVKSSFIFKAFLLPYFSLFSPPLLPASLFIFLCNSVTSANVLDHTEHGSLMFEPHFACYISTLVGIAHCFILCLFPYQNPRPIIPKPNSLKNVPLDILLPHLLCPHWEQLKRDAGARKKTLCGHRPWVYLGVLERMSGDLCHLGNNIKLSFVFMVTK